MGHAHEHIDPALLVTGVAAVFAYNNGRQFTGVRYDCRRSVPGADERRAVMAPTGTVVTSVTMSQGVFS